MKQLAILLLGATLAFAQYAPQTDFGDIRVQSVSGNGGSLTNLNATNLVGSVSSIRSGAASGTVNTNETLVNMVATGNLVVSNNITGGSVLLRSTNLALVVEGEIFAGHSGNGINLTNLSANALGFGTVPNARLTGTTISNTTLVSPALVGATNTGTLTLLTNAGAANTALAAFGNVVIGGTLNASNNITLVGNRNLVSTLQLYLVSGGGQPIFFQGGGGTQVDSNGKNWSGMSNGIYGGSVTATNGFIVPGIATAPTIAQIGRTNTIFIWASNDVPPTVRGSYYNSSSNLVDKWSH
jgi:hypothetical protein